MDYLYTCVLRPHDHIEIDVKVRAGSASCARREARAILQRARAEDWEIRHITRVTLETAGSVQPDSRSRTGAVAGRFAGGPVASARSHV